MLHPINSTFEAVTAARSLILTSLAPLLIRVNAPPAVIAQLLRCDLDDDALALAMDRTAKALVRALARALAAQDWHTADLVDSAALTCNRLCLSLEVADHNPRAAAHLVQRAKIALYQAAITELSSRSKVSHAIAGPTARLDQ
jgi:hypothetical protein